MQDAVVEVAAEQPMTLQLASAVVTPGGKLEGTAVRLDVGAPLHTRLVGDHSSWDMASGAVLFQGNVVFKADLALRCDHLDGEYREER